MVSSGGMSVKREKNIWFSNTNSESRSTTSSAKPSKFFTVYSLLLKDF